MTTVGDDDELAIFGGGVSALAELADFFDVDATSPSSSSSSPYMVINHADVSSVGNVSKYSFNSLLDILRSSDSFFAYY